MPDVRAVPITKPRATFTHLELMGREFGEVRWGINGLVPQGVSLLAAKPKIGKSWLALQCCWAKAAGKPVWEGRLPEAKGTALYIALEDNPRRLQTRSRKSFPQYFRPEAGADSAWHAEQLDSLHFATEWPRIGDGGIEKLNVWLTGHPDCDLVAIDTLARIRASRSGDDSYAQDYAVGERLKAVADAHSVAIMLVHHTRKMEATDPFDTISGTQGLAGSVDASLVLTRMRGNTEAGLFVTGRDIEDEIEIALEFDKCECRWIGTGKSMMEAQLDQSRQDILEAVRQASKATIKGIRGQLMENGISKSLDAVAKSVGRMVKDGQLEKVDGNQYRAPVYLSEVSE